MMMSNVHWCSTLWWGPQKGVDMWTVMTTTLMIKQRSKGRGQSFWQTALMWTRKQVTDSSLCPWRHQQTKECNDETLTLSEVWWHGMRILFSYFGRSVHHDLVVGHDDLPLYNDIHLLLFALSKLFSMVPHISVLVSWIMDWSFIWVTLSIT
jgi:hypothetical protein